MKTFRKVIVTSLLFMICFMISACQTEVEQNTVLLRFSVAGGTSIATQVVNIGEAPKTVADPTRKGYEFKGWYIDADFTEEFDFTTTLTANTTIYAKWEVLEKMILVAGVSKPEGIVLYESAIKEKDNKRTEFMDRTIKYQVGVDNAFSVKPTMTFISYDPLTEKQEPVSSVRDWEYDITLSLISPTNSSELTVVPSDSPLIDAIDYVNATVDFSEEAINQAFLVEVTPKNLTELQLTEIEDYTISFSFDVVEGYNVYDEKELGYLDNRISGTEGLAWVDFKIANNLKTDYYPTQLILHKNLVLTTEDVPSTFFYQESELSKSDSDYDRALGSMKDHAEIYYHTFKEEGKLSISGNFFQIDASSFKEVVREDGNITPTDGQVMSHASLFKIVSQSEANQIGEFTMSNLNLLGNAPRVEDTIKAGGQIIVKIIGPKFTAYNNIASCSFITYFAERTNTEFLMEKCKAYDAFNSFVYNHASENVVIKECEMIGAGGPIIIQDHLNPTSPDGGKVGNTVVIDSNLESKVAGSEGWFTVVQATSFVYSVKQLNNVLTPFNKSYLVKGENNPTVDFFNLICVNKSGSAESITAEKIKGSLKIDENAAFDFGATNPYLSALLEATYLQGAPAFQTSTAEGANGIAYSDGTYFVALDNTPIVATSQNPNLFTGDYICLYYNGMAFTLGYYDIAQ